MTKRLLISLTFVFAVCFDATIAHADVEVMFPAAGDAYCSATNGCGTIPAGGMTAFMWTAGDYVQSPIFHTGQPFINEVSYDFMVYDDLGGGNNETVAYFVNGVQIGGIIVPDCNYCGQNMEFSGTFLPGLIGPLDGGYQLEMILQNTIPSGGGSIAFDDGGTAGLGIFEGPVPEPSSILLLCTGVLGMACKLRRKINL